MRKQTKKQKRALRSAAALKGWETRRAAKQWWIVHERDVLQPLPPPPPLGITYFTPDPANPWLSIASWIKAQWRKVFW